ncbi:hypothetical protein PLICRDRAFT_175101 [Plicaturopsis crispa FD-325 SS-3]|nr:hypothetical protein PLICRDRAFT_175101 [Plicaturopsis crispa FD-325 SS-3]
MQTSSKARVATVRTGHRNSEPTNASSMVGFALARRRPPPLRPRTPRRHPHPRVFARGCLCDVLHNSHARITTRTTPSTTSPTTSTPTVLRAHADANAHVHRGSPCPRQHPPRRFAAAPNVAVHTPARTRPTRRPTYAVAHHLAHADAGLLRPAAARSRSARQQRAAVRPAPSSPTTATDARRQTAAGKQEQEREEGRECEGEGVGVARLGRRRQRTTGHYALSFGVVFAFAVTTRRHTARRRDLTGRAAANGGHYAPSFDAVHALSARAHAPRPPFPWACSHHAHPHPACARARTHTPRTHTPALRAPPSLAQTPTPTRTPPAHTHAFRTSTRPPRPPHARARPRPPCTRTFYAHAHTLRACARPLRTQPHLPRTRPPCTSTPHPCMPMPHARACPTRAPTTSALARAHRARRTQPFTRRARTYAARAVFFFFENSSHVFNRE